MLRLTKQKEPEVSRLKTEGRLAGTEVHELEGRTGTRSRLLDRPILIDLTGVTFLERLAASRQLSSKRPRQVNELEV